MAMVLITPDVTMLCSIVSSWTDSNGPRKQSRQRLPPQTHLPFPPCYPPFSRAHIMSCREALAAKDAATAVPELGLIDTMLKELAEYLGRSHPSHNEFKELQEVFCQTNLELQGIHAVRWLSRGDAITRLVRVLPAVIVLMWEWDDDFYPIVTSVKFNVYLYYLVDMLIILNNLNLEFQKREVSCPGLPSPTFPPRPSLPGLPSPAFPPRPSLPGLPSPAFPPRPSLPDLPSPAFPPRPSLPGLPSPAFPPRPSSLPRISPFSPLDSPFTLSLLCPSSLLLPFLSPSLLKLYLVMWQVDMTSVQSTVRRTLITIRTRYIECSDDFGGGPQQHLGAFLARLSKSRKVTVDGVDKEGRPRKHSFELHEEALTGYSKTPDDLQSCLDVCRRHAKSTLSHLQSRLGDLESLNGVRLFMPDTYPDDKERRAEECLEHFETLVDLFHARERADILPGVDKRAAKRELRTFVPVLAGIVDLWRSNKKRRPTRRREKQRHRPVSAAGKGGDVLEDGQETDTEHGSSSSNDSGFSSSSDDDDEEEG
ncbi:unnamed protein product [Closterium sp. Naga37s-1]|nr:unnamed protein product [Closterium sp. Naga37s-1]